MLSRASKAGWQIWALLPVLLFEARYVEKGMRNTFLKPSIYLSFCEACPPFGLRLQVLDIGIPRRACGRRLGVKANRAYRTACSTATLAVSTSCKTPQNLDQCPTFGVQFAGAAFPGPG
jgi:hypothetical protein